MTVVDATLAVLALAFVAGILRIGLGPSLADRALAADVCLFTVVSGLGLLAVRLDAEEFLDVVVVATLLGFIASVAFASLLRGRDR